MMLHYFLSPWAGGRELAPITHHLDVPLPIASNTNRNWPVVLGRAWRRKRPCRGNLAEAGAITRAIS